ncbi:hypothetical protein [Arenibacter echinorum]|uniref:Uncharacterized protein n=1 Tax=Arenibacter echinorum TaxID=440515 RepID=A0A327REC6_9FLAO|nr:hypothetical protein [Arenibacter echinorum]RAJ15350.1 hypothetical protein LV92_00043 [Arenibacter echinorum]
MDRWKRNNLLSRILGKLRRILRLLFYNGSSVTSQEKDTAKALQAVLLELKNIKLTSSKEDSVPS